MGQTIIFADFDGQYLERIRDFFVPEYGKEWQILCCGSPQELQKELVDFPKALVAAGVEFAEAARKYLRGIPVVLLWQEPGQVMKEKEGAEGVFRYQRMDELQEAFQKQMQSLERTILFPRPEKGRIYLFQSASGGCGCSTAAAACAKAMASTGENVLYLNLESMGTAGFYFKEEGSRDLLQYLFDLRTGKSLEQTLSENLKRDESGVCFIDSVRSVMDYPGINMEELLENLKALRDYGLFDRIIVDKPLSLDKTHWKWVSEADQVVFVGSGSDTSNMKFARVYQGMVGNIVDKDIAGKKFRILYNKIDRNHFKELSNFNVPVLGRIENYEKMTKTEVIDKISKSGVFAWMEAVEDATDL